MGDGRAERSSAIEVLLYSIRYCTVKYTKAQPLVEDARM